MPHGLPTSFSPTPTPNLRLPGTPGALLPGRHHFLSGCLASLCLCSGAQSSLLCGRQAGSPIHQGTGSAARKAFLGDLTQMWHRVGTSMELSFLCLSIDLIINV